MPAARTLLAVVGLMAATLAWALNFPITKSLVATHDPGGIAAGRFALAGAAMAVCTYGLIRRRTSLRNLWRAALPAGLGIFGYNYGFVYALKYTTALHGVLIIAATPAITAVLGRLFFGERVNRLQGVGIFMSFCGVSLIIAGESSSAATTSGGDMLWGDFLFLVCAVMFALYSHILRSYMSARDSLSATTDIIAIGSAQILLVTAWHLGPDLTVSLRSVFMHDLPGLGYLALFGTVFAFFAWGSGVSVIGATRTAIFLNMVPIWGSAIAFFIYGQTITALFFASLVLVILGIILTQIAGLPSVIALFRKPLRTYP